MTKSDTGRRTGTRLAAAPASRRFTDDYLPFLLAQASAVACAEFADSLRAARLSNLAWRIMATLRDEGPLSVGRLSEIVLARQPRVTQIVNDLARARYVDRRASAADGRVTMVAITAKGERRIGTLLGTAKAREGFALAAIGPGELGRLKRLLRLLLGGGAAGRAKPARGRSSLRTRRSPAGIRRGRASA